jgi:hypothetical protein
MICKVSRLRARGIRVSAKTEEATTGDLRVNELTQSAFGRAVRVAQLLHPTRPSAVPELLPPLFDVQLLQLDKEQIVLSGIERECVDGQFIDYAQTWLAQRQK